MADQIPDATDQYEAQLMAACDACDINAAITALNSGADPSYQEPTEAKSCLMAAAESGNESLVTLLLEAGAIWHAQDVNGYTAGEYCSGKPNILKILLEWAVKAEMILGIISSRERSQQEAPINEEYLKSKVEYVDPSSTATTATTTATAGSNGNNNSNPMPEGTAPLLVDAEGEGVMMEWERELMEKHAEIICPTPGQGHVLNVGFGLGIIDTSLQQRQPKTHTIIEAHPDVYNRMIQLGWDKKPGVKILFGRWQDVIDTIENFEFDGVFFDTYGEYYEDMKEFHSHLPRILRPGGVYSFFNGLAPDNVFFHLVYGEIARIELGALGMEVTYRAVKVNAGTEDASWKGVKNRYWYLPVYFLPTCIMAGTEEDTTEHPPKATE